MSNDSGDLRPILELGRGGVGRVTLAIRSGAMGFERVVVVKRLHEHLVDDRVVSQRFVDEARIAASLHHANVVGVQQIGKDESGTFLVFDYVEGETLQRLLELAIKRGVLLPPRVVVRVILDALAGLSAVHDIADDDGHVRGVIHRDISPDNLLVGTDGITRIADFGMARDPGRRRVTEPGTVVGKALFVAPEYIMERPIDARVDVYSMGVTLWIALSGLEPYPAADDQTTLLRAMRDGVPPLSEVLTNVPPEFERAVAKACARDPRDRYASAREMAQAIDEAAMFWERVGTQSEVVGIVDQLAGESLAQRRATIGAARESVQPPSMPPPSDAPIVVREPSRSLPEARPQGQPSGMSAPVELPTTPFWKSGVAIGGAAVIAIVILIVALRGRGETPPTPADSPVTAKSASPPPPTPPIPSAPTAATETSSATPPPAPAPTETAKPAVVHPSTVTNTRPPDVIKKTNPYK